MLSVTAAGCATDDREGASQQPSAGPSLATPRSATSPAVERDGVVKAPPTVRLAETDEFGLVVRAERRDGAIQVTVDRVDSLTGGEGERAAMARGADFSNDHVEVNDSPRTREYVLADDVVIWQSNPFEVGSPQRMTVAEWLAYLRTDQGRQAMFHFDLSGGRVVGIEEQYFP